MIEPRMLLRGLAAARVLLGVSLLIAPRKLMGLMLASRAPSEETVLVLRMLAARDAALGLGGLLADRHGSAQVRGWGEAGALSDAVDAAAFAAAGPVHRLVRIAAVVVSAGAAVTGGWAARRLS